MAEFLKDVRIIENSESGLGNYLMKVKLEENMPLPEAGQFYLLKCKDNSRILKRPVSVHYVNRVNRELEFFYRITGMGTKELSLYEAGEIINIQGPLGTGFNRQNREEKGSFESIDNNDININATGTGNEKKAGKILVAGGGIGIAPLKELIESLREKKKIIFIAGGRDAESLKILENFDLYNIELHICSDDGSMGQKGFVPSILEKILKENQENSIEKIYTCGPHIMMERVAKLAEKNNIECEVSLEERMACGVKACVGCSIKTKDGMKKVCYDGPVFDSRILMSYGIEEDE